MVVLGLVGLVVLLPLEPMPLELGEELLPLVAPPLLLPLEELDLLKYASHSERDTCPSLFVSTLEKVGAMLLDELLPPIELPLEALPPLDIPEDPDEPEAPVALGDLSVLELEDELCAIDTLAIAKRAAAVAVPTIFNIWRFLLHEKEIKGRDCSRQRCKEHAGHDTSFRRAPCARLSSSRSAPPLRVQPACSRRWESNGRALRPLVRHAGHMVRHVGPRRALQAIEAAAR